MKIKTVSSILDVVEPEELNISEDLKKDEKISASIKEIFTGKDEKKEKNQTK